MEIYYALGYDLKWFFKLFFFQSNFVGAFASTNLGDVSPNTKGPYCLNTGEPCETVTSTCKGDAKQCVGRGPGKDHFESTKIIATNLFKKATVSLFEDTVYWPKIFIYLI